MHMYTGQERMVNNVRVCFMTNVCPKPQIFPENQIILHHFLGSLQFPCDLNPDHPGLCH